MPKIISIIEKSELISKYEELKSMESVSKYFKCSTSHIFNVMKKYNIPRIPMKGRKLHPEHREKVIKTLCGGMAGKKHSNETKSRMSETRKGSNNGNWKDGKTQIIRKFRRTKKYILWVKNVIENANNICTLCGSKNKLQAHHIISVHKDLSKVLDVNNGVALCEDCHMKIHNKKEEGAYV